LITRTKGWELIDLLEGRHLIACVYGLAPAETLTSPALSVFALDPSVAAEVESDLLNVKISNSVSPIPGGAAVRDLVPVRHSGALQPVADRLLSLAAQAAWAGVASKVSVNAATKALDLEYFGYQRTMHSLEDRRCFTPAQAYAAIALHDWVAAGDPTDPTLAIRQVVSLYPDNEVFFKGGDVKAAAEPIFTALRSDAVADAAKSQREVRGTAMTVGRQSADASIAMAKGTLASLIAIGGVIVARSTKALTDGQAHDLRSLIALFLVFLAVWSFFIEGPPVTRVVAVFKAERRGWIVRFATPVVYLAAALLALLLG
jgi:hypothetical protein